MNSKYNHTEIWHTHDAGREIVPWIMDHFHPETVIDVGCGIGTFTSVFKQHGCKVLGVDGPWCNKKMLFKNIDPSEFLEHELEKPLPIKDKFDLAFCLEVAEHLTPQRAPSFIEELTRLSDIIIFSAAIPGQGGDHHFNEQWLPYWKTLFEKCDFEVLDILRPIFWENKNIFWWYRQNIVLVKKKSIVLENIEHYPENILTNVVHPDLFTTVTDYKDPNAIKRYLRSLSKALAYKLRIISN